MSCGESLAKGSSENSAGHESQKSSNGIGAHEWDSQKFENVVRANGESGLHQPPIKGNKVYEANAWNVSFQNLRFEDGLKLKFAFRAISRKFSPSFLSVLVYIP